MCHENLAPMILCALHFCSDTPFGTIGGVFGELGNVIGCFWDCSWEGFVFGGWAAGEGERCGILGNVLGVAKLEHEEGAILE